MIHHTLGAPDDLRTRIVQVAVELFAERGFAGTSIRDIAGRLSVTKAALYYHFASKEQILEAVVAPILEQLRELGGAPVDVPAGDLVARFVSVLAGEGSVLPMIIADPSATRALKEASAARPAGASEMFALMHRFARRLAGPDPSAAAVLSAHCALGAAHAGIFSTIAGGGAGPEHGPAQPPRPVRRLTAAEQMQVTSCALAALRAP